MTIELIAILFIMLILIVVLTCACFYHLAKIKKALEPWTLKSNTKGRKK